MPQYARLLCTSLVLCLATQTGVSADTSCESSQDSCDGTHSSLFAIAHDHNDISNILYRVALPEQATGSGWGDGINGFFYQVQSGTGGDWTNFVPFNGIGSNADGVPTLRPFSFIVPVAKGDSTLSVRACSTNYTTANEGLTDCTQVLWTDSYTSLPSPSIGSDKSPPPSFPNGFDLEFVSDSVLVRNNGVYGAQVTLKPTVTNAQTSLTQDQIDWLYDHIVFVDVDKNVHDNNLFPGASPQTKPFGVLKLEEAGYPEVPGGSEYLVKYTQSDTPVKPTEPGAEALLHFWVYSTDTTTTEPIQLGAGWLYDASADCVGAFNGDEASNSASCGGAPGPEDGEAPYIEVTLVSDGVTASEKPDSNAGLKTVRNIAFTVEDTHQLCTGAVNPLAAYSETAANLPNYVLAPSLASSSWTGEFPTALYYVLPSGFGNCAAGDRPFCERTSAYSAYIPHYLDTTNGGGSLNGGGTANRLVGSMNIADQYALSGLSSGGGEDENSLIWFDNCGYGHEFTDSDLGSRNKSLPTPPFSLPKFSYTFDNAGEEALVLAKDCCASWYQIQPNSCTGKDSKGHPTGCTYNPPEQIGQGYGLLMGGGGKETYQTIFSMEAFTVYDAGAGTPMFSFSMGKDLQPVVSSCTGAPKVSLDYDKSTSTLTIDPDGGSGVQCGEPPACPPGLVTGATFHLGDIYTTCTAFKSTFVPHLDHWRSSDEISSQTGIALTAWGATGALGNQGKNNGEDGGAQGHEGLAQTIVKPADLPDALYIYVAEHGKGGGDGGSASVVSKIPLSTEDLSYWVDRTVINNGDIFVIAAGGGGGGYGGSGTSIDKHYPGGNGGAGGIISATSDTPAYAAGQNGRDYGSSNTGGRGGSNGTGGGGGSAGTNGVGGFGTGGTVWLSGGALVPPTAWSGGNGGNASGGGGAGFGGGGAGGDGGSGQDWGHGGGGGSSWAAGVTGTVVWKPATSAASPNDLGHYNADGGFVLSVGNGIDCEGSPVCTPAGGIRLVSKSGSGAACLGTDTPGAIMQNEMSTLAFTSDGILRLSTHDGVALWSSVEAGSGGQLCFSTTAQEITLEKSDGDVVWKSPEGQFLLLNQCSLNLIESNGAHTWGINMNSKCS